MVACETQAERIEDMTDNAVVDCIIAGDGRAWQEIVRRYGDRLTTYCNRRLRDLQAAEDVVQETLISFMAKLPTYDNSRDLEHWLFHLATCRLHDKIRYRSRRPAVELGCLSIQNSDHNDFDPQAIGEESVIEELAEMESVVARRRAVASVLDAEEARLVKRRDERRIMCFRMLFREGRTNADVATATGLPNAVIANIKFEISERLRDAFSQVADLGL